MLSKITSGGKIGRLFIGITHFSELSYRLAALFSIPQFRSLLVWLMPCRGDRDVGTDSESQPVRSLFLVGFLGEGLDELLHKLWGIIRIDIIGILSGVPIFCAIDYIMPLFHSASPGKSESVCGSRFSVAKHRAAIRKGLRVLREGESWPASTVLDQAPEPPDRSHGSSQTHPPIAPPFRLFFSVSETR